MTLKSDTIKYAFILIFSLILAGADTFMYSNPIVKRGNLYYKKKKYKKSIELYLRARQKVEDKEAINFNIANAYYKNDDFNNALKFFDEAIKEKNDAFNSKVLFNMGNCYFKKGELKNAYEKYKSALKLEPANNDAKYNLEFVLDMMEENKEKKSSKKDDNRQRRTKRNFGSPDDGMRSPENSGEGDDNNEIENDNFESNITFNDDFEDISKNDALRILNTMTEQVIMRVPKRREHLTKKGEGNEKDW